jgi:uncharacterized LabA/DUF88 family protein
MQQGSNSIQQGPNSIQQGPNSMQQGSNSPPSSPQKSQQGSDSPPSSPPNGHPAEPNAASLSSNRSSPTKTSESPKVEPTGAPGSGAAAQHRAQVSGGGKAKSSPPSESKPPASGPNKKAPKEVRQSSPPGGSRAVAGGGAAQQPSKVASSAVPKTLAAAPIAEGHCQIFVDVSNIWKKTKRHQLRSLLEHVESKDFYRTQHRFAFGSKTPEFASSLCDWEIAFQDEGFTTRSELRPEGCQESMVDDCIAAHMYRAIDDKSVDCLVLLSGDGNQRNPTGVSIMDAVLAAMAKGIRVVVWSWKDSMSDRYRRMSVKRPDSQLSLNYLDECVRHCSPSPPGGSRAVAGGGAAQQPSKVASSAVPQPPPSLPAQFTITLRSATAAVIDACPAPVVMRDVREDLKQHAADAVCGLKSTGESFGRNQKDFIYVNFSSLESAQAALRHYQACKELNLQGKKYAVTAKFFARKNCNIGSEPVIGPVKPPLCIDLLGLEEPEPAQSVVNENSQWIDSLFDTPPTGTDQKSRAIEPGHFLGLLWDGSSVESDGASRASSSSAAYSSSESDSDDARHVIATSQVSQSDNTAQEAELQMTQAAVEAHPAAAANHESLLPSVEPGDDGAAVSQAPSPALQSQAPSPAPQSQAPSPAPQSQAPSPAPQSQAPSPAPHCDRPNDSSVFSLARLFGELSSRVKRAG